MLGMSIVLYLLVNLILAFILWFAGIRDTEISTFGYFLAMLLFGLFIIMILLILFIVAILTGASYNFGGYIERKMKEVF